MHVMCEVCVRVREGWGCFVDADTLRGGATTRPQEFQPPRPLDFSCCSAEESRRNWTAFTSSGRIGVCACVCVCVCECASVPSKSQLHWWHLVKGACMRMRGVWGCFVDGDILHEAASARFACKTTRPLMPALL